MIFVSGQAVVESSFCVIVKINIKLGVSTRNSELCLLLKKEGSSSVIRVHYHRISYPSICKKVISTYWQKLYLIHRFLEFHFYSKQNTKIKMLVQLSHKDGLQIASSLHEYFTQIHYVKSCR